MITKVFAIKDRKSTFWSPFTSVNEHVAKRDFTVSIARDQRMRDIATDLELYRIGEYDDSNAVITSDIEYICSGIDVMEVTNE